jgi:hypothetical protein
MHKYIVQVQYNVLEMLLFPVNQKSLSKHNFIYFKNHTFIDLVSHSN